MYLAVGTSFEMIVNWEMLRRERSQIEKEKMSSELSFLRSQMNPHFLFNTLNNIYSLAEKKSDKTGEAVLMISALLRYILYDSSGGKISLAKEIECLENYIAIQRLRISSKESVTIQFNVTGNRSDVLVEPLILLPFVENAFKHGVSYSQKCNVLIEIGLENSTLKLHVYNTKKFNSQHRDTLEKDFGIGLNNVKKRLALLYPEHHELLIEETDEYFEVQLKILL
jgi:LytS/YehU family sensor histidine kinase